MRDRAALAALRLTIAEFVKYLDDAATGRAPLVESERELARHCEWAFDIADAFMVARSKAK